LVTSENGINLLKRFEGCRLRAYRDVVGVWTIGFGHTGPEVVPGLLITSEKATEYLEHDLAKFESAIIKIVNVPLSQCQFDALVCLTYNIGISHFSTSTLLTQLNAGNYVAAANEFTKWDMAGGKQVPGLLTRRCAERSLFNGDTLI